MTPEIEEIVTATYDAVLDPGRFPDVLSRIAALTQARGCLLFDIADQTLSVPFASEGYSTDSLNSYMQTFAAFEAEEQGLFAARADTGDDIEVVPDVDILPDGAARAKRANVQALAAFGIAHRAFSLLDKDNTGRYRFSLQHDADHGPVTVAERKTLSTLLPHLAKALQLGKPEAPRPPTVDGLLSAMSGLGIGVCLLDRDGNVVAKNAEHDRQSAETGAFVKAANGRLRFATDGATARLNSLLSGSAAHGKYGARPRREALPLDDLERGHVLCVEIAPLEDGGACLFGVDTSQPLECDTARIGRVFSLTPAERDVVGHVCEGLRNAQIAERRSSATETVNVQMRAILKKTRCANRNQLVRMLMNFGRLKHTA